MEQRHGNDAGPDGGFELQIETEIQWVGLSLCFQISQNLCDRRRHAVEQREQDNECAYEQHAGLDHVGPNDGGDAAHYRVDQGNDGHDDDRRFDVHAGDELDNERGCVEDRGRCQSLRYEEYAGNYNTGRRPESSLHVVVYGGHAAVEEKRQKQRNDNKYDDRIVEMDRNDGEAL